LTGEIIFVKKGLLQTLTYSESTSIIFSTATTVTCDFAGWMDG